MIVDVQGTRIHYRQVGSGPDLLLVHGLPGTLEDWQPLEGFLADSFRLTAIDRPGHGESDATGHEWTLEYNAAVVLAVIEKLALKEVTIVGHSYGGATAVALAVENPPAVRAVVALAPPSLPHPAQRVDLPMHLVRIPLVGPRLLALLSPLVGRRTVERGIRAAFRPNHDALPSGFIERNQRVWLGPKVVVTTSHEVLALAASQRRYVEQYPRIRKRLVLVHGAEDRTVRPAHAEGLHRIVSGSELILLEGVGHYLQFARPEQVAGIIRRVATGGDVA